MVNRVIGDASINGDYNSIPENIDANAIQVDKTVGAGNLTHSPEVNFGTSAENVVESYWQKIGNYLKPRLLEHILIGNTTFVGNEWLRATTAVFDDISSGIVKTKSLLIENSADTFYGTFLTNFTANREITIPDKSGTIAFLDDLELDLSIDESNISDISLTDGVLKINYASTVQGGLITSTDWNIFNSKENSLVLNFGEIIVGNNTGYKKLSAYAENLSLFSKLNEDSTIDFEFVDVNSKLMFTVPQGYEATTHTAGAIPAGTIKSTFYLEDGITPKFTLLQVIQNILFGDTIPNYIIPTLTLNVSIAGETDLYVEYGDTVAVSFTNNVVEPLYSPAYSSLGVLIPGGSKYSTLGSIITYMNNVVFTAGNVLFDTDKVFKSTVSYNANTECNQKVATSIIPSGLRNSSLFNNYPTTRVLTSTVTYYATLPIFYGCVDNITSSDLTNYTTLDLITKEIKPVLSSYLVSHGVDIVSYTGSVDPTAFIIIAIPETHKITKIMQESYTLYDYTTPDSSAYKVTSTTYNNNGYSTSMRVYYLPNNYNTGEIGYIHKVTITTA